MLKICSVFVGTKHRDKRADRRKLYPQFIYCHAANAMIV
jgi:hypothetical protein